MRTRPRSASSVAGAVCLLMVPLLGVAAVLPFLEAPTYGGLLPPTTQLVHSVVQGYDSAWVVVVLLILGAAAASHLAGIQPRIAAFGCLAASTTALAFALFELSNGGSRVLTGGWGLPNTYGTSEHLSLDAGFYVFVGGAAAAVVASIVMVVTSTRAGVRAPGPYPGTLPAS